MQLDVKKFIAGLHDYIGKALAPLYERISDLESRSPIKGDPGEAGPDGPRGEKGDPGERGEPGKSVTVEDIAERIELCIARGLLDFERRAQETIQRAIDRIPAPKDGIDGRDGMGFDDLVVEHDGIGNVTLRLVQGDRVKEHALRFPVFIDRGIYRDEEKYQQGNGVTLQGSIWIAQCDDPQGRPGTSKDWRLAVKKGRDGREVVRTIKETESGP